MFRLLKVLPIPNFKPTQNISMKNLNSYNAYAIFHTTVHVMLLVLNSWYHIGLNH